MEGDIGHNEEAVPNFLTEQLSALGKDQRAMIEWGWAKAHSHGYTKGICPCGCGRLFWSIAHIWEVTYPKRRQCYVG